MNNTERKTQDLIKAVATASYWNTEGRKDTDALDYAVSMADTFGISEAAFDQMMTAAYENRMNSREAYEAAAKAIIAADDK